MIDWDDEQAFDADLNAKEDALESDKTAIAEAIEDGQYTFSEGSIIIKELELLL